RHLRSLSAEAAPAPRRSEQIILWILSVAGIVGMVVAFWAEPAAADPSWKLLLVFAIGVWAGTLYTLGWRLLGRSGRAALPTEGIVLWGMVFSSVVLAALWPVQTGGSAPAVASASGLLEKNTRVQDFSETGKGVVVSSPLLVGDRVYVAAAHKALSTFGTLYCLDRSTLKVLWSFDDDGGMKQVFSSPCVADGRLYLGEGFQDDKNCKLYCVSAATGAKLWEFRTTSQTEASPCVAAGKVFFGAGNDGVYCLDAAGGQKRWQFPGPQYRGR